MRNGILSLVEMPQDFTESSEHSFVLIFRKGREMNCPKTVNNRGGKKRNTECSFTGDCMLS